MRRNSNSCHQLNKLQVFTYEEFDSDIDGNRRRKRVAFINDCCPSKASATPAVPAASTESAAVPAASTESAAVPAASTVSADSTKPVAETKETKKANKCFTGSLQSWKLCKSSLEPTTWEKFRDDALKDDTDVHTYNLTLSL